MNSQQKVSVIIPTYNRVEYLQKAIETVLAQSYTNIEIIIIDDASDCDNKTLIDNFQDTRISYIQNKKRRGAPHARNIGIEKAQGTYLAFLDDDDEWDDKKIEKQLSFFTDKKDGLVICYSLDKRFGRKRISKPPGIISYTDLLRSFNLSSTSSYLLRKDILEKIGLFDETLPSGQEYDLALRIAKHYTVKTYPEVLMIQNASEGQISENWGKKIKGIIALYQKFVPEYKHLSLKPRILNHLKVLGLITLFFSGYLFGNTIYSLIIPMKEKYEHV